MALPQDMQAVQVILLKRDIARLDAIVKERRLRSRSLLMRMLIERGLPALSLSECSDKRAKDACKDHTISNENR